ncbi:MAG: hypothetical protein HKP61_09815 [Dactylosporangium sp.]|nr:hypothetical protein [Dactylosporangium sp.]NNJ61227.1 hypothetical protein [Dactylosporangium sp.]
MTYPSSGEPGQPFGGVPGSQQPAPTGQPQWQGPPPGYPQGGPPPGFVSPHGPPQQPGFPPPGYPQGGPPLGQAPWQTMPGPGQPPPPGVPGKSGSRTIAVVIGIVALLLVGGGAMFGAYHYLGDNEGTPTAVESPEAEPTYETTPADCDLDLTAFGDWDPTVKYSTPTEADYSYNCYAELRTADGMKLVVNLKVDFTVSVDAAAREVASGREFDQSNPSAYDDEVPDLGSEAYGAFSETDHTGPHTMYRVTVRSGNLVLLAIVDAGTDDGYVDKAEIKQRTVALAAATLAAIPTA